MSVNNNVNNDDDDDDDDDVNDIDDDNDNDDEGDDDDWFRRGLRLRRYGINYIIILYFHPVRVKNIVDQLTL